MTEFSTTPDGAPLRSSSASHPVRRVTALAPHPSPAAQLSGRRGRQVLYAGRYQPAELPADLVGPVEEALRARDGARVVRCLVEYLGRAWNRRNGSTLADHVVSAFQAPLRTVAAKVRDGDVTTVPGLQVVIEQVLAMSARKYGSRAFRRSNPRVGYGQPVASADRAASPPLFVSARSLPLGAPDRGGRPEDALLGEELAGLIARVRASVDPRALAVFDAVQSYRVRVGVAGGFPFVAGLPAADHLRPPVAAGGEGDAARAKREKAVRSAVRRTWLRVRRVFADRLAAAGYTVPADNPR